MSGRREFLKQSALLSGAALLSSVPLYGAYAGEADKIKLAVVGCGGRGTGATFDALNSGYNIEVVAMCDAFRDNLDKSHENLKSRFGDKINVPESRKYVGFDGYKSAIADADVVILATSPGFRPIHFEEAVRQGKHIFMEKPVAVDIPGARKVLAAAEIAKRKKLNVVVGLQRRYQFNYREVINRIREGEIGDIVSGQVYWNSGGVWVRPRTPEQTEMEYQMRNWYYFNWLCGDHIVEQHVHQLDVASWVKGAYPVKIQGTGSRAHRTGKEYGEIYDNFSLELTYEDGTAIFSQCAHFEGAAYRVDESFQGTKGRVYLDGNGRGVLYDYKGNVLYRHNSKGNPNPYQQEHKELFEAISKGEHKFNDAEYGAHSTLVGIIGRLACYTGKVIQWDKAMQSDISLAPESYTWDAKPQSLPDENGFYSVAIPGVNTEKYIES